LLPELHACVGLAISALNQANEITEAGGTLSLLAFS